MSKLEIQTGEPPEPGRYVVWTPCKALQAREWCEPSIATWQGGRWHSYEPVWAWIGPLPVVHGNDCLPKPCQHETTMMAKTGDGVDVETCLDCGEHIYIGSIPREPEYDL
jgi:hypothetical protein